MPKKTQCHHPKRNVVVACKNFRHRKFLRWNFQLLTTTSLLQAQYTTCWLCRSVPGLLAWRSITILRQSACGLWWMKSPWNTVCTSNSAIIYYFSLVQTYFFLFSFNCIHPQRVLCCISLTVTVTGPWLLRAIMFRIKTLFFSGSLLCILMISRRGRKISKSNY